MPRILDISAFNTVPNPGLLSCCPQFRAFRSAWEPVAEVTVPKKSFTH